MYVWIASQDQILIAEVGSTGDGKETLTATYKSDFPGDYLIYVEEVDVDKNDEGRPIQESPFSLTISGEPKLTVDTLPVCGTAEEDIEETFWRTGTWLSSSIASLRHGVTRNGWVFQPKRCVYDTFSRDDLLKLADLEEETWILFLGNSVFRGVYLTLVDMALDQGQKDDLPVSALNRCWGYADIRIGNLRVTYQVSTCWRREVDRISLSRLSVMEDSARSLDDVNLFSPLQSSLQQFSRARGVCVLMGESISTCVFMCESDRTRPDNPNRITYSHGTLRTYLLLHLSLPSAPQLNASQRDATHICACARGLSPCYVVEVLTITEF